MFINGSYTDVAYQDEDPSALTRDSDEFRILAGLRWTRGVFGSGSLGVGYQNKRFATDERDTFSGLSWSAGIEWHPLARLSLTLDSSRASVEPPLDGDFIRQVQHLIALDYTLYDHIAVGLDLRYLDQAFFGIERNETTLTYGADLDYQFRSNIVVTGYYHYQDKASSLPGFSFEQNVVGLRVTLGLK